MHESLALLREGGGHLRLNGPFAHGDALKGGGLGGVCGAKREGQGTCAEKETGMH